MSYATIIGANHGETGSRSVVRRRHPMTPENETMLADACAEYAAAYLSLHLLDGIPLASVEGAVREDRLRHAEQRLRDVLAHVDERRAESEETPRNE